MLSWVMCLRGLGASSSSSSATRSMVPSTGACGDGGDVEQGGGGQQGGVGVGHAVVSFQVEGVVGRVRVRARSAATVSAAMWSSAWAGSVMTWIRSHSTLSGAIPIERWIVGTLCSASQRTRATPAWVSAQPPSREHVHESGAAGVCHLELLAEQLDRVAGERGAAAGLDPGNERQRSRPVGEQGDAVAEQGGGAASADLSEAVGEDPADRSERVLVGGHRAGGVDHQSDVRLLDRRGDLPGDPPRVGADGPSGLSLRFAAGVGAAVEPPAGGALVDPLGALRHCLPQPGGVAAGLLDLVWCRWSVDASVGHPAGRHPGPASRAPRGALLAAGCRVREHLLQVDVRVELLELAAARLVQCLLERLAQRARCGLIAAPIGCADRRCSLCRGLRTGVGRAGR